MHGKGATTRRRFRFAHRVFSSMEKLPTPGGNLTRMQQHCRWRCGLSPEWRGW